MGSKQESLIYIEKDNTAEAEFMSRSFVDREIRNRAYINALGAELGIKYLASEGFNIQELHNLHSISKLLEKYDIADILLPNIHIDVRVVFDEKQIFIPKSHYKMEMVPDIYLIFKLDKGFGHVEFLGFIEADKINFKNTNTDYYFVEKNKLTSPDKLKQFIKDFTGTTSRNITEEDMLRGRELSVALSDHNTSQEEEKELLELLLSSDVLRESVLEFDNFETLAYNAAKTLAERTSEGNTELLPAIDNIQNKEINILGSFEDKEESLFDEAFFAEEQKQDESGSKEEEEIEEETQDLLEEDSEELTISDEPVLDIDNEEPAEGIPEESPFEENLPDISDNIESSEPSTEETELPLDIETETNIALQEEPLNEETLYEKLPEEKQNIETSEPESVLNLIPDATSEQLVDKILDNLIDNNEKEISNKDLAQTVSNAIQNSLEKGAAAAEAAAIAGTTAAGAGAADAAAITAGAAATYGAIKLAGVAGDRINNIVEQNIEKQQKNLNRIDYKKTDIAPDVTEIPEHIKAWDGLSVAKMEANKEVEESGEFGSMLDLNELKQIDDKHEEVKFEQETVDLNMMDTVESEDIIEDASDAFVNLSSINVSSPTKPVENAADLQNDAEFTGMDLPDLSSYTINEDGTSNRDNFAADINFDNSSDENLIDMKINAVDNFTIEEDFNSDLDSVPPEDLFAGDKIITKNLDEEPVSEFENDDFTHENEIINLDEQENDICDAIPAETTEGVYTDEIPSGDLLENATNEEDIISESEISEEISLEDFSALEDPEVYTESELTNAEFPQEEITPEVSEETAQEWVEDTNYDNLQDIEPPAAAAPEDIIVEPEAIPQKVYAVSENSTIISDRNYNAGEIAIDINSRQIPQMPKNDSIENLYDDNPNIAGGTLLQTPGRLGTGNRTSKSGLGGIMKFAGGLIVLAVVCIIGFNVAKMFKAPAEEAPQPITDDAVPTAPETTAADNNTLNVNPDNVITMDDTTNALANPTTLKTQQQQTPVSMTKKQNAAILNISKLTWEVPDYISFNTQFKQYFQAAGKSLKLSLTSDLLLATDYAYSNEVKVSVTFAQDGTFKNAQILKSSGSTQIDNIVLQTVNQTLKVLKAPHSVGNDESTTAILKIYF